MLIHPQGAQWALVPAAGDTHTVIRPVPTPTQVGSGQQRAAPQPGHILIHPGNISIIKGYEMQLECECDVRVTSSKVFIS